MALASMSWTLPCGIALLYGKHFQDCCMIVEENEISLNHMYFFLLAIGALTDDT